MKMIIVALALVAVVAAVPVSESEPNFKIIRSDFDHSPNGGYSFNFETDNGIKRQEQGDLKEVLDEEKKPHSVVIVRGQYEFPDENGKPQIITYFADENGYHAEGDAIPKVAAAARR